MDKRIWIGVLMIIMSIDSLALNRQNYHRVNAMEDDVWNCSQWISVADAPVVTGIVYDKENIRVADGANWFAFKLENEKEIKSAIWMTTGLGIYELFVNGQLIGDEILKPGFSHYKKTKYSFTYDITGSIDRTKGGLNVFSAQVTPGWWADKIITPSGNDGFVGKKCAFRCVLKLVYNDGTENYYGSDTLTWVAGIAGRVKHADIYDGEVFDAREKPGYESIDDFKTPVINNEFNGKIKPNEGAEVYFRDDLVLNPVRAYTWQGIEGNTENEYGKVVISKEFTQNELITISPGETLVVDFGQNCSAVPNFLFSANKGTTLTCLPSELLNEVNGDKNCGMDGPEGSVYRANLRIPETGMRIEYTFAGEDEEAFIPRCTYFGYRYISVTATDVVTIHSLKSIPVSSITQDMEIGTISTGNDLVNQLISNVLWSERSNYLSVPTDCPQRNERLGYTGDAQVFATTGTFFANTNNFFHKWLQDLRDVQSSKGGFPGVAPYGYSCAEESNMMRVGWSDAGIIVPFSIWKQFGDLSILEESWESMEKYMDHVNATKYDHNALIEENGNYQWADWLSYEPLGTWLNNYRDGNKIKEEALDYWNFLCSSYWLMDAENMYYMAKALGKDTNKYSDMIDAARDYIRTTFLLSDGQFKNEILNTMQTSILFALKNKLVSGEAKEKAISNLLNNFSQHDNCLQTGFLGTSILMQTLTENGLADKAYELLYNENNPSWLYSVLNGATTMWERWDSYVKGVGMKYYGMNSFNHYAYGSVCQWIWETVAGISADPLQPGFKHIIMKPIPDKRLGYVDAEYKSPAGVIKSNWWFDGDDCIWKFTIPVGTSASVSLPGEEAKEYGPGNYTVIIGQVTGINNYSKREMKEDAFYTIGGIKVHKKPQKGLYISDNKLVLCK